MMPILEISLNRNLLLIKILCFITDIKSILSRVFQRLFVNHSRRVIAYGPSGLIGSCPKRISLPDHKRNNSYLQMYA